MDVKAGLDKVEKAIQDKPVNTVEAGEIIGGTMNIIHKKTQGNRTTTNTFKVKNR